MGAPPNVGLRDRSTSSRVQEFINFNLLEFAGSDPQEDPLKFIDEL